MTRHVLTEDERRFINDIVTDMLKAAPTQPDEEEQQFITFLMTLQHKVKDGRTQVTSQTGGQYPGFRSAPSNHLN